MVDTLVALPAGLPADPTLLAMLLDLLPMGVIYYTPVVDAAGTLTDLTLAYLNPAAQRMTQLPAQPSTTYRQQFPTTDENGAWDFHRRSWLGPEPGQFQFYYDADGFDAYFRVTAQRLGEGLVAIFTDTQDEVRSQAEQALLASQAREQERARQLAVVQATVERERAQLQALLAQAPVAIALYQGSEALVTSVNDRMAALWGYTPEQVLGQPLIEGVPELQGQGFDELLRQVQASRVPYLGTEMPATMRRDGVLQTTYYNFVYQPFYDPQGQVLGVINVAVEVTEQVVARRQLEHLNAELESRVQERTQELAAARATAERERAQLRSLLDQAPVAIALFEGDDLRLTSINAAMAAFFGSTPAQAVGRPLLEAVPELRGQGLDDQLRQVLHSRGPVATTETPVSLHREGRPGLSYYNSIYQPLYGPDEQVLGVLAVAVEVTAQVLARQQVEQLNQELEARVQERTQELAAAQAATERERAQLQAVLTQAPVAIALFQGEEVRFASVNAGMAAIMGSVPAQLLGRPLVEALPELQGQGFDDLLRQVLRTRVPLATTEVPVQLQRAGRPALTYYNSAYQPLYGPDEQVLGVLAVAVEVTAQVLARQQVEQLNQELEARVQERTRQLSAQQALLGNILRQVPAAVATLHGPEHRYSFFNEQYQQLAHSRAAYGLAMAEAVPEATAQGFVALLDQVYQTGQPFVGQELLVELQQPDGTLAGQYFNFVFQPLQETQSQVHDVLAFAVNVTEQVLARQEREARQGELQRLFEQAPVAVAVFRGPQYVIELANPSVCAIWGRTQAQAVGTPLFELLPEAAGQGFEQLLDRVMATGEPFVAHELPSFIDRHGRRDTVYWNFVYAPLREADGRIERVTVVATEVTEQVLVRRQADEAAAELRLLTAHAPAFLFRTDPAGSLVYLNKEFFEWTGLDAARLGSLDEGWAAVHPGDLAVQQPSFLAAIQAGQPWQSTPYRFRRRDGQYRWMLSRSQPLFGPEGQVLGHTGLTVEIHEQIELQQQLERTNVDLDNFIYTASHDLKAPITNIDGLLLALEHELPAADRPGDVSLMLTMMQDAVNRFRRTIDHLTDLSRLQKEHSPDTNTVPLAPVVEAVRLDLTPLLAQTQGQLTVSIPDGLTVTFAEKNLRSVVYNLLSNAFKYRHPDREPDVQLRASLTDEYVVLTVQDNGLGLDLAQGQERLFGMFQRLHTHVEGTGVGLYMVKRILENVGGRIEVSSELGVGTTFWVYFRR